MNTHVQYWSLLNWRKMRFGCGFVAVPVNWNFVVISPWFAIFKNVVHSLKPSETPRYSASLQASNYVQRSWILRNILKRFGAVAAIFSIYLKLVLYVARNLSYENISLNVRYWQTDRRNWQEHVTNSVFKYHVKSFPVYGKLIEFSCVWLWHRFDIASTVI